VGKKVLQKSVASVANLLVFNSNVNPYRELTYHDPTGLPIYDHGEPDEDVTQTSNKPDNKNGPIGDQPTTFIEGYDLVRSTDHTLLSGHNSVHPY
jgi:hypothetical protein